MASDETPGARIIREAEEAFGPYTARELALFTDEQRRRWFPRRKQPS